MTLYHHAKKEGSMSTHSKVISSTDRHTETHTLRKHYLPTYAAGKTTARFGITGKKCVLRCQMAITVADVHILKEGLKAKIS